MLIFVLTLERMESLLSLVEVNIGNIWMQLQHSAFPHRGEDVIQESAGESWEKDRWEEPSQKTHNFYQHQMLNDSRKVLRKRTEFHCSRRSS